MIENRSDFLLKSLSDSIYFPSHSFAFLGKNLLKFCFYCLHNVIRATLCM